MFAKQFYSSARRRFTRRLGTASLNVICFVFIAVENKLTFDLPGARLALAVVADDPGVLAMATVVHAGRLFDAVGQRVLLATAFYVVHVDGTRSFPEIRHHTSFGHAAAVDTKHGD